MKVRSVFTAVILAVSFYSASAGQSAAPITSKASVKQLHYGLVVDNSGSLRLQLEIIVDLVKDVVAENRADDQAFLIRFISSDKISLTQDFTTNKELLGDAADAMYIEGGRSALLDAVNIAADHLREGSEGATAARALLLITDGDDRENSVGVDDVLLKLKKSGIRVFAVGVSDVKVDTKILDKLTRATGGKMVLYRRRDAAVNAAKEIATAMRAN